MERVQVVTVEEDLRRRGGEKRTGDIERKQGEERRHREERKQGEQRKGKEKGEEATEERRVLIIKRGEKRQKDSN